MALLVATLVSALVGSARGGSSADPCAGANNATGTTLCGCGKFVPLSVPTLNLGCVGPAGSQVAMQAALHRCMNSLSVPIEHGEGSTLN